MEKTKRLKVTIPERYFSDLHIVANEIQVSVSSVVRLAIDIFLYSHSQICQLSTQKENSRVMKFWKEEK